MGERQLFVGGEVEVGEDHLSFPHAGPLGLDRLLHFHDHVGVAPNGIGVWANLRADGCVGGIREPAPFAGALLHHHAVASGDERFRTGRH